MIKKEVKIISFTLFLLGFLLYANTLGHGYVLDDFSVIKDNFVVKKGIEGIPTIWKTHYRYGYGYNQANLYRPLTLTLFALQWEIAPDSPSLAHWFNVLLYAILGVLIFRFLEQLLGVEKRLISFLSAALFVAHPIHTEVVANIKSIDDILAMGLSLSSIMLLLKHLENPNKKLFGISLLLFALAFLCKESTITFLALIPLSLVLFRSYTWSKALKISSWYLLPTGFYFMLRIMVLKSLSGHKTIAKLDNLLMAAPNELSRIATAIKIMGLYLWKLLFPHPLMNDYSINQIEIVGFNSIYPLLSLALYGVLIYFLIRFWNKQPIISYAITFFLITISLYSNLIITIGTSFGERLLFVPSLGFCLLLAFLIKSAFTVKAGAIFKQAKAPILLTAALVLIYSFKTIDRNRAWKDNFTLYSTDVQNCAKSARCQYYYGLGLMKEKALATSNPQEKQQLLLQSIQAFDRAIEILPKYSDAWGQKGLAYFRLNNYAEAEKAYRNAIAFNASNATVYSNLGSLYFNNQNYAAAKEAYENAIRLNPNYLDAIANYASTLGTLGDYNGAISYFKKAIALQPNEASYYRLVGITYQNLGDQQQANIYLQKAQQLQANR